MTTRNKLFACIAILLISISACKKEMPTSNANTTLNPVEKQNVTRWLLNLALPAINQSQSFKNGSFDCAVITSDTTVSPHTMTFDYGTGCADENGVIRKGKIVIAYNNADIHQEGTLITYSFNNFYINNDQVTGGLSLQNTGVNGSGNLVINYLANYQDLSNVNGSTQIDANENLEWTAGQNTNNYDDDVFSVTGFDKLAAQSKVALDTILQPLIMNSQQGCNQFYVQGVTLIQMTGQSDITIDYGNGACDNLAVETVNGQSHTITLQ